MSAFAPAIAWWHGLQHRERWMVGTMLVMLAAFAGYYGVMRPLERIRDAQAERYDRAASALAALQARDTPRDPLPAADALADSARTAGLGVTGAQGTAGGAITIEFASTPAPALFAWLDQLRQRHGVVPTAARIDREADGVSASLVLPGPGPAVDSP